jgi:hypothetical protein
MDSITREEGGWSVARTWLAALEETARDFHGTHPKAFCERGYEHATIRWYQLLEEQFGITVPKAKTMRQAIENHIALGVRVGLFRDASQFELNQVNPYRVEITALDCPYRFNCEQLLDAGFTIRDLTCARIGVFRSAAEILSGIKCKYEVTGFHADKRCEGYVEHR